MQKHGAAGTDVITPWHLWRIRGAILLLVNTKSYKPVCATQFIHQIKETNHWLGQAYVKNGEELE